MKPKIEYGDCVECVEVSPPKFRKLNGRKVFGYDCDLTVQGLRHYRLLARSYKSMMFMQMGKKGGAVPKIS